jgi:hypothetical protein
MSFEHACFISYRHHEQSEIQNRFVQDLCTAIRNELALLIEENLFIDRDKLRGGAFFDRTLSKALCKSICMIAIYTPTYFSTKNPYCAREFRAMEALEKNRLDKVSKASARENGLIIPVVLRGEKTLPPHIKNLRHFYSFERFALTSRQIARDRQFALLAKEIADVIADRRSMLDHVATELTCGCDGFDIPTEAEVLPWLDQIKLPPAAFPFRKVS